MSESRDGVQDLDEASAESGIHITINKGIVAAVRHGQPVTSEPDKWQRSPCVDTVVVEHELKKEDGEESLVVFQGPHEELSGWLVYMMLNKAEEVELNIEWKVSLIVNNRSR